MAAISTQVLICGAGPAGLALAVELGTRGVKCIVVERNDRVGYAPRAKTTHTRTREHFRRWGIAEDLAAMAPFGVDYPSNIQFVTRLGGFPLATIENAFNCAPERNEFYAEHAQWVPQYRVEEVLRRRAESLPSVQVLFEHEFLEAEQDKDGVTCRVRAAGADNVLRCDYLVGADGARSAIRDLIGAQMEGRYGLAHAYNIVFRAPGLSRLHKHGPGIMYWQINADVPSVIGPMDKDDLWYFMRGRVEGLTELDKLSAAELIQRSMGLDTPIEILSTDEWAASEFIADKYSEGRIFLIGDACHLHPPVGGYGMNMGIGDSVDLGWKMAAVLHGWGGQGLLKSYEQERRQVHRFVIDAALSNHATLSLHDAMSPTLEADSDEGAALRAQVGALLAEGRAQEFRSLGVMLGASYDDSPIMAEEGGAPARDPAMRTYEPTARPGARAPHAWLDDGRSLYDVFGEGFTLIGFERAGDAELQRAEADAHGLGIPLKTIRITDARIAALYERSLVLIRPDQHVAWRGDVWPGAEILLLASGRAAVEARQAVTPKSAVVR
ncbi:FAD-dependent monooxygenase [Vitreimonas sp.]|uniref:FAD-dependent monooxygenase n=1 Tax=Vitreimonas sp. TaxID=3069702 RepID=UPI002ED83169